MLPSRLALAEAAPESFHVARDRDRVVRGFTRCSVPSGRRHAVADPIASGGSDVDANPMPYDQRQFLCATCYRSRGRDANGAACWLDIKARMAMRPATAHLHGPASQPERLQARHRQADSNGAGVGDDVYHLNVNDFGPESVDGWLAGLVAAELGVDVPEVLDRRARVLVLGKDRVPLTRLEFGLLEYLLDREGQAVSRASLMQDVWGNRYTGSNVIEAVVRSLRKKLRERASCVETVSGVGYRFRSG